MITQTELNVTAQNKQSMRTAAALQQALRALGTARHSLEQTANQIVAARQQWARGCLGAELRQQRLRRVEEARAEFDRASAALRLLDDDIAMLAFFLEVPAA